MYKRILSWIAVLGVTLTLLGVLAASEGSPPKIQFIDFPSSIPADGQKHLGFLFFQDGDGDVRYADFEVLEGQDLQLTVPGFEVEVQEKVFRVELAIDPEAQKKGTSFSFELATTTPQQVKIQVILEDEAGSRSDPEEILFTAQPIGVKLPDLVVSLGSLPSQVQLGDTLQMEVTVSNRGESDSGPFRIGIYLSADDTITAEDLFLVSKDVPGLGSGESITEQLQTTITEDLLTQGGIEPGPLFLGVIADDLNQVEETIETNNTASTALQVISPAKRPAFFEVVDLSVEPSSPTACSIATIKATIENTGEEVGTKSVELYIDDVRKKAQELTLNPGQREITSFGYTFIAGSHQVEARTPDDARSLTVEVQAGEAKGYIIHVSDDEVILDLGIADGVKVGDEYRVFREQIVKHPVTGEEISVREDIGKIKIEVVEEKYSIGKIIEVAEGKQIEVGDRVEKVAPQPDLLVESILLAPEQPIEGDEVSISAMIENVGEAEAEEAENIVVVFEVDGQELGRAEIESLPAGSSQEAEMPGTWGAEEGEHEIRVIVDPDNEIEESDEGNNALLKKVSVPRAGEPPTMIDIKVEPDPIIAGEAFSITHLFSDPDKDVVSLTQTLTYPDGARRTDTFPVTSSDNANGFLKIPGQRSDIAGTLIIEAFVTDAAGNKSNEMRRSFQVVVPHLPDLALKSLVASEFGEKECCGVSLHAQVENKGDASAGSFEVSFLVDGSEIYSGKVSGLAAGEQAAVLASSIELKEGQYTLTINIDPKNGIKESDEENNRSDWAMAVKIEEGELDEECLASCQEGCDESWYECEDTCWWESETEEEYEECVQGCDEEWESCRNSCKDECVVPPACTVELKPKE